MINKILLDTSYLLPILGVEIDNIKRVFEKLLKESEEGKVKLFYASISLFEALGKITKLEVDEEILKQGMRVLKETDVIEEIEIPIEAYLGAMNLKKKGFKDFIDLLLFETACKFQVAFLSRDKPLLQFIEKILRTKSGFY